MNANSFSYTNYVLLKLALLENLTGVLGLKNNSSGLSYLVLIFPLVTSSLLYNIVSSKIALTI